MAAVADIAGEATLASNNNGSENFDSDAKPKSDSEFNVPKLAEELAKLTTADKEFSPSSSKNINKTREFLHQNNFAVPNKQSPNENFPTNRMRRKSYNQGENNSRVHRGQTEDSVKRTVYVSDIDKHVTKEGLADFFSSCGQIVDCRVCASPHSVLRFALAEFADQYGAGAALKLDRKTLGYYPVRISPSRTAIRPLNPTFLPRVSQAEVKSFFESKCGEVTRLTLRLSGDQIHSSWIAFVEFAMAESAVKALDCSGMILGARPISVNPSETPVRPQVPLPTLH